MSPDYKIECNRREKYKEIAEELDISINTIRTQVSRGYKKMREILSEEEDALILWFALEIRRNN